MTTKRSGSDSLDDIQTALVDANVLINFVHLGQLDLLSKLKEYRFVIPEHVAVEIKRKDQAATLKKAFQQGILEQTAITDMKELADYAEFHKTLGQGESACLAIAVGRGFSVASDEKGLFRRLVLRKIGLERLLTTPDLILTAIRSKLITVTQADKWKAKLETHRFKMTFQSFRGVLVIGMIPQKNFDTVR
ncbi:MAG: hypothetical protein JW902_05035 [Syntrophaceae bacterium]|nr:hypothetical protein [Syntrophaceae bacterium]